MAKCDVDLGEIGEIGLSPSGGLGYDWAMKWTIPNTLTFMRLLAAPGVAVMFLYFLSIPMAYLLESIV